MDAKTLFSTWGGTEPPFRENLLFGYAQSGSERTSFSGSPVAVQARPRAHRVNFDMGDFVYSIIPFWPRTDQRSLLEWTRVCGKKLY